jgi:hypothetical protein
MRNAYNILVSKSEVNRPIRRCKNKWKTNIKMDLKTGCHGVDWIQVDQDRIQWQALLNMIMNLWVE